MGAGKPGTHAQGGQADRLKQHDGGPERRDRAAGSAAKSAPRKDQKTQTAERLQKVLAQAGLGSRRGCEELIRQGRVTVDGEVVTEMGTRVEPSARVAVDGEPIRRESIVYFAVNKPEGYVSTNSDPSGRPRVVDLVPEIPQRVYTVGRLDEDSTGLIILTNDGELANRLAHPKYGVEKLYRALVAGIAAPETLAKLTEGVWLSDGKVRAKRVRVVGRQGQATMLELVLAEGRKREIRRMLAKLGHKVMSLTRVAVGPVTLKGLPVGECRPLTRHEVELLQQVADGVRLSVPGFPDEPRSRAPHGPARERREATGAPRDRRRDQEGPEPSRGEHRRPRGDRHAEERPRPAYGQGRGHGHGHKQAHGHGHGPAHRSGGGRPAGPRRPGGPHGGPRPMRPRAMDLDLDEGSITHGAGSPPAGSPPRGPRAGASGGG
ncbi:MAG: pseudouridine synthase, partial [Isosphaeraceae bacterium]